jgi:hypothetical protein
MRRDLLFFVVESLTSLQDKSRPAMIAYQHSIKKTKIPTPSRSCLLLICAVPREAYKPRLLVELTPLADSQSDKAINCWVVVKETATEIG